MINYLFVSTQFIFLQRDRVAKLKIESKFKIKLNSRKLYNNYNYNFLRKKYLSLQKYYKSLFCLLYLFIKDLIFNLLTFNSLISRIEDCVSVLYGDI